MLEHAQETGGGGVVTTPGTSHDSRLKIRHGVGVEHPRRPHPPSPADSGETVVEDGGSGGGGDPAGRGCGVVGVREKLPPFLEVGVVSGQLQNWTQCPEDGFSRSCGDCEDSLGEGSRVVFLADLNLDIALLLEALDGLARLPDDHPSRNVGHQHPELAQRRLQVIVPTQDNGYRIVYFTSCTL